MSDDFLKSCVIYGKACREAGQEYSMETFRTEAFGRKIDVLAVEQFFESTAKLCKWDLGMLLRKPKILADCCFLEVKGLDDLIVAYGYRCATNNISPPYFDEDGEPILGGIVKDLIASRMCSANGILECAKRGATISVLIHLDDLLKRARIPGEWSLIKYRIFGVYEMAARHGHLEIIEHLRKRGCNWNIRAAEQAVEGGHLDVLQYLHARGCPLDKNLGATAIARGHFKIVEYLHGAGYCPVSALDIAVTYRQTEIIEYLLSKGYVVEEKHLRSAIHVGSLKILKRLLETGCSPNAQTMHVAAFCGNLEIVKHLCSIGCPMGVSASFEAARRGAMSILSCLCENGCPVNENAVCLAARNGYYDIVVYLHSIKCPWNETATQGAAEMDNLDILKFLCDNGCPVEPQKILALSEGVKPRVAAFLKTLV